MGDESLKEQQERVARDPGMGSQGESSEVCRVGPATPDGSVPWVSRAQQLVRRRGRVGARKWLKTLWAELHGQGSLTETRCQKRSESELCMKNMIGGAVAPLCE